MKLKHFTTHKLSLDAIVCTHWIKNYMCEDLGTISRFRLSDLYRYRSRMI